MYEHLLVALDGSPAAEQVVPHARALAKAFGSKVTLLRATIAPQAVITQTTAGGPGLADLGPALDPMPIVEADQNAASEYLADVAAGLRQEGLSVSVEQPQGAAEEVIVERARELGVGLILMTTHGRSGLGRMVFGSVADAVLRHARCPVLLVRISPEPAAP